MKRRVCALVLGAAIAGCTLSGTAKMPLYVCAAQDSGGERLTCDVSERSSPGDGCRCVTKATGARGPDIFYGRVVAEDR